MIMRTIKFLLAILFSLAVIACGGGGYGGGGMGGGSGSYSISGTVSGGATDHSGVLISLTGAATKNMTTIAGGSYIFTGLANGYYTVTPSKSTYTFTPTSSYIYVYGGNMTQNFMESP
jgi:hypothetical protein